MSGPIRRIVKPAKKRLADLLLQDLPTVDQDDTVDADRHVRELQGAKKATEVLISKIQKTVQLITEHFARWEKIVAE